MKWWVLATSLARDMHTILSDWGYVPVEIVEVLAWPLAALGENKVLWLELSLTNVGRLESEDELVATIGLGAELFGMPAPSFQELDQATGVMGGQC